MRGAAPLFLLALVMLSGSAVAFSFSSGVVLETRDGEVEWRANATVETNSLVVKDTEILIGGQRIDINPDGIQQVRVYITKWAIDNRTFRVVMKAGESTGLNVTWSNGGELLSVYQGTTKTHECLATTATCNWQLANGTSFTFSVLTPVAAEQAARNAPPPLEAGGVAGPTTGGGGGGGSVVEERTPLGDAIANLPSLPDLFPRLTAAHWLGVIIGGVLVFNGGARTRVILPPLLRFPLLPPIVALGVGVFILGYIWLNAGAST